jgi:hypothetical protein
LFRADGQTYVTKLIAVFRNIAKHKDEQLVTGNDEWDELEDAASPNVKD